MSLEIDFHITASQEIVSKNWFLDVDLLSNRLKQPTLEIVDAQINP